MALFETRREKCKTKQFFKAISRWISANTITRRVRAHLGKKKRKKKRERRKEEGGRSKARLGFQVDFG